MLLKALSRVASGPVHTNLGKKEKDADSCEDGLELSQAGATIAEISRS